MYINLRVYNFDGRFSARSYIWMTLPELCIEIEIRLFGTLLMSEYIVL